MFQTRLLHYNECAKKKRRDKYYFLAYLVFFGSNVIYLLSVHFSQRVKTHYSDADFISNALIPVSGVFLAAIFFGMLLSYSVRNPRYNLNKSIAVDESKVNKIVLIIFFINLIILYRVQVAYGGIPILIFSSDMNVSHVNATQGQIGGGLLGISFLSLTIGIYLTSLILIGSRKENSPLKKKYFFYLLVLIIFSLTFGKLGVLIFGMMFFIYERLISNKLISLAAYMAIAFVMINFIVVYRSQGFSTGIMHISISPFTYILDYYSQSAVNALNFIYSDALRDYKFNFLSEILKTLPTIFSSIIPIENNDFNRELIDNNILQKGAPSGYYSYFLTQGYFGIFSYGLITGIIVGWFINRINNPFYEIFFPFLLFAGFTSPIHVMLINHFFLLFPFVFIYSIRLIIFKQVKLL